MLLPFLSVLRVQDVSFEAGQATRVRCQFQGVSDRIWADADIFFGDVGELNFDGLKRLKMLKSSGFHLPKQHGYTWIKIDV